MVFCVINYFLFYCFQRKQIWISCQGENSADREALGEIEYYPAQGFRSYYYPFTNTPGYLSPIVAVRFARPSRKFIIVIEKVFFICN